MVGSADWSSLVLGRPKFRRAGDGLWCVQIAHSPELPNWRRAVEFAVGAPAKRCYSRLIAIERVGRGGTVCGCLVLGEPYPGSTARVPRRRLVAAAAIGAGMGGRDPRAVLDGVHPSTSGLLQAPPPLLLVPGAAAIVANEGGHIDGFQVAIALMLRHSKHERPRVEDASDQLPRPSVEAKCIPSGEEEAEQHLESADHGTNFGHDEHKPLGSRRRVRINGDATFNLEESRTVNQGLGLRIDGVGRVRVGNGSNGLNLFLLLSIYLLIVELDVSLEDRYMRPVIGRSLLELLLQLCVLLLIRRRDDAPAASPGHTSTKANANPLFGLEPGSLHDDIDVVDCLTLAGDESTGIGFLEGVVLVNGEPNTGGPLDEGVIGVEVQ